MNRIGSLCTGYGGLDMAVERVLGGEMVWYSEFEKHPSTLLSARFAGIPNLGDLTKIDWHTVPEIDVLTGGYPCQPFSVAGRRLGENDPRHLWPHIREAIRVLRPRITFLENVSNHRRIGFDRVLGDCAEDGLHVRWATVRVSDVGAPHQRERLFFVITNPDHEQREEPRLSLSQARRKSPPLTSVSVLFPGAVKLLPTPRTTDSQGGGPHGDGGKDLRTAAADAWGVGFERGSAASVETERAQQTVDRLRTGVRR